MPRVFKVCVAYANFGRSVSCLVPPNKRKSEESKQERGIRGGERSKGRSREADRKGTEEHRGEAGKGLAKRAPRERSARPALARIMAVKCTKHKQKFAHNTIPSPHLTG